MVTPPKPTRPPATQDGDKVADAAFLHDQFGIDETVAADLVIQPGAETSSEAIVEAVRQLDREKDPLEGVPTPREPENDLTEDNDEERLKPVVRVPNDRVGGG